MITILTTGDKIIIAVLLLLISLAFAFLFLPDTGDDGANRYAVIQVNGEIVEKIQFTKSKELAIYPFGFGNEMGEIEIMDGRVRMKPMDIRICPEGICSNTGWIERSYESIVCLPNKIVVTLENVETGAVDVLTR